MAFDPIEFSKDFPNTVIVHVYANKAGMLAYTVKESNFKGFELVAKLTAVPDSREVKSKAKGKLPRLGDILEFYSEGKWHRVLITSKAVKVK
jgi:hypothetical protein